MVRVLAAKEKCCVVRVFRFSEGKMTWEGPVRVVRTSELTSYSQRFETKELRIKQVERRKEIVVEAEEALEVKRLQKLPRDQPGSRFYVSPEAAWDPFYETPGKIC